MGINILVKKSIFSLMMAMMPIVYVGCQKEETGAEDDSLQGYVCAEDSKEEFCVKDSGKKAATEVGGFVEISFKNVYGAHTSIARDLFKNNSISEPLDFTAAGVNQPLALFHAGISVGETTISPYPYIAFYSDERNIVTVRHKKVQNAQTIKSQIVTPIPCPEYTYAGLKEIPDTTKMYCIPLIVSAIPDFLSPADSASSVIQEFTINAKNGGISAGTLELKFSSRLIIPDAQITLSPSEELKKLKLHERTVIASNDLLGGARRDFIAFELKSDIAAGVPTSYVLNFTGLKVSIDQEVFFEMPVRVEKRVPIISRGYSFYKRSTGINSINHFRVRILDPKVENKYFNVASGTTSVVEVPISDPLEAMRLAITLDFGSDVATKSMSEYVKAFAPTFCPLEAAAFKSAEWLQNKSKAGFIACEAKTRKRYLNASETAKAGVSIPIETFYGSFSYMGKNYESLGGTNGVFSTRVTIEGEVSIGVRSQADATKIIDLGKIPLSYSYQLPSVLTEMDEIIRNGKASYGLDTIYSSLQRKGVFELPKRQDKDGKEIPSFTFMGLDSEEFMH